jgi:hypothetical protein
MPLTSNEEKEFLKALYLKRMDAVTTVASLRVVYELAKAFDIPITDFCRYIVDDTKFNVV